MAIGNLGNKVSADDVARVKDKRNPPEYEAGFEPDGGGDEEFSFSDMFEDINFDDDTSSSSGEKVTASSIFGLPPKNEQGGAPGAANGATPGANPFSNFGQPAGFVQPMQQAQPVPPKPDTMDKIIDSAGKSIVSIGKLFISAFKSIKNRTADDWGMYSRNVIITSAAIAGSAILIAILGAAANVRALKLGGIPFQMLRCAMLSFGTGLIGISIAALRIASSSKQAEVTVEQISDVDTANVEKTEEYEDDLQDLLGELFGDESEETEYVDDTVEEPESVEVKPVDFKEKVDGITAKIPVLTREIMFNIFKPFFPLNTPGFAERKDLDPDSSEFATIETICLKALAAASRFNLDEIDSHLESAVETYFCYELRVKRVKGLNKLEDIAREITAYFRDSSEDASVSSEVDIEGDFYKIIVNKGVQAIVTFGDIFKLDEAVKFYKDTKNILPLVAGITEAGKPLLVDAKHYSTILVAGKPRSGKSWYVLSIIMSMMMFNVPEDVVFVIIDPKESNLFKTISLMPHVCGLHSDTNILQLLRDIIEGEGARRKKLLSDHKCDDIWELRKRKGIMLPVLYVVIDEIMTVVSNLGENSKEFFELMRIIISQLPSAGVRMLFVPHRAQGVVDKTIRTLLDFTVAVRADAEVVRETLDIKKWDKPLLNPGDAALKLQGRGREVFVKGPAITTSDSDNSDFIINVAKAFYKMGVDIPDMTSLLSAYNRNEGYIKEELEMGDTSHRVQFDIDNDI